MKVHTTRFGQLKYKFITQQKVGGILFEIPLESPICAQFVNEHSGHYFGKQHQLLKELQVGLEDFDNRVYIYSEQVGLKELLLRNPSLRELILKSLDDNGVLIIDRKALILKQFPAPCVEKDKNIFFYKSKKALFEYCEKKHEIPNGVSENWCFTGIEVDTKSDDRIFHRGDVLGIMSWMYLAVTLIFLVLTKDYRELMINSDAWVYSFSFALIFSFLLFWLSFKYLRSTSWTFKYLVARWIIQTVATFILAYNAIPFMNIRYDNSIGTIVDAELILKRRGSGKVRPSLVYNLHAKKSISHARFVSMDEFNLRQHGEVRKFQLHNGRFGFRWGKFLPL